jgi:hypothetical protein
MRVLRAGGEIGGGVYREIGLEIGGGGAAVFLQKREGANRKNFLLPENARIFFGAA